MSEEKKEECGIVAIFSKNRKRVAPALYKALMALQHRGQDAAGFAVVDDKKIENKTGIGLVSDIFKKEDLEVVGNVGIGHTRYPTIGKCRPCDVQPTVVEGVAIAHNGHIANYEVLKKELEEKGKKLVSTVDSEPIAMMMNEKKEQGIKTMVKTVMEKLDGAYSDVMLYDGKLIVFRDPHAIRPLVWGENENYLIFASESVALNINGVEYKGDVQGGEVVIVDRNGNVEKKKLFDKEKRHCMFEYVYFSRPDSIINGKLVHEVRMNLGKQLAIEHPVKADVVIPVPDTSRSAAVGFSKESNIEFGEGLIKNRYIGRTFIMPNQEKRREAVLLKLNPIKQVIDGKKVVLVDDSIVRGTTVKEIVSMVRDAGAKEVHLRITCPPIKAPCFYGVDMSTYEELIANKRKIDEIREFLGVDSLGYLSIGGLKKTINSSICTGCLNEEYITDYAKKLANERKESKGC